ncbi:hypothetical protein Vafri_10627, partial [Volvox africanus]
MPVDFIRAATWGRATPRMDEFPATPRAPFYQTSFPPNTHTRHTHLIQHHQGAVMQPQGATADHLRQSTCEGARTDRAIDKKMHQFSAFCFPSPLSYPLHFLITSADVHNHINTKYSGVGAGDEGK